MARKIKSIMQDKEAAVLPLPPPEQRLQHKVDQTGASRHGRYGES